LSPLPCTILLSQHKWAQTISGATGIAPASSNVDRRLLEKAAVFVKALNDTHAAQPAAARPHVRFVMEFVTNRVCPQIDVKAIPEGILLVSRDNWEEAMGPVFGTRNLQHHVDVQQVAMEQRLQLQASGGFLFPLPGFTETTCTCAGDCAVAGSACPCMELLKPCNSSCHVLSSLPPGVPPSHSQCKNPQNAAHPSALIPMQQPLRGQACCGCKTGCSTLSCGCRKRNSACTTACHGMSGHDSCLNRTQPAQKVTDKKKRGAEGGTTRKAKKAKGATAAATAAAADDDDEEDK
jgi:hypothetical protein